MRTILFSSGVLWMALAFSAVDAQPLVSKVRINTPENGERYYIGSNVCVGGAATDKRVVKVRIRLLHEGTTVRQVVADVTNKGGWGDTLHPPNGGFWPGGDVTIEALGLDAKDAPVKDAKHSITLQMVKL